MGSLPAPTFFEYGFLQEEKRLFENIDVEQDTIANCANKLVNLA